MGHGASGAGQRVGAGAANQPRTEAGSFVYLPRQVPHAFVVTSAKPVVALQLTTPAGFEQYVAEIGGPAEHAGLPTPSAPDIPRLMAAGARHHYELVGPPLSLPTA